MMTLQIILSLILITILLKYYNKIQTSVETLAIIYAFAIVIVMSNSLMMEGFDNNEALQNIAALYNSGTMTVSNLKVTGNVDIDGNVSVSGNSSVTGKSTVGSDLSVVGSSNLGNISINSNKISAKDSVDLVFGTDKSIKVCDVGTTNISTASNIQLGNITSAGSIKLGNTNVIERDFSRLTKRNLNVAGLFGIRGYSFKIPLYLGWNFMWADDGTTNYAKTLLSRYGTGLKSGNFSYCGVDMRSNKNGDTDANWQPSYLAVYPGYTIKLFYWDYVTSDTYNDGEYFWEEGDAPKVKDVYGNYISRKDKNGISTPIAYGRVHAIYVTLSENTSSIPNDGRTLKQMST